MLANSLNFHESLENCCFCSGFACLSELQEMKMDSLFPRLDVKNSFCHFSFSLSVSFWHQNWSVRIASSWGLDEKPYFSQFLFFPLGLIPQNTQTEVPAFFNIQRNPPFVLFLLIDTTGKPQLRLDFSVLRLHEKFHLYFFWHFLINTTRGRQLQRNSQFSRLDLKLHLSLLDLIPKGCARNKFLMFIH